MIRPTTLAAGRVETVVGEPSEVANALRLAHDQGRLIEVTEPRSMADGRISVGVRLVEARPTAPRRSRRPAVIAGIVVGVLVALGGIGVALAWIIRALVVVWPMVVWPAVIATLALCAVGSSERRRPGCKD